MDRHRIDLNADLGESFGPWRLGEDAALLEVVTTAHVACGFHAGDPAVMSETVAAAKAASVTLGAHPSYPDMVGFGRRSMAVAPDRVRGDVLYQLGALDGIARAAGTRVRSVKPHGALYHRMAVDPECTEAIVRAVQDYDADLWLVVPAGSAAIDVARAHELRVAAEAFCDRRYRSDGTLASRAEHGLVTDPGAAAKQALALVRDGVVTTAEGTSLELSPQTISVHGDTPGAAAIARAVRAALQDAGFEVAPFVPGE